MSRFLLSLLLGLWLSSTCAWAQSEPQPQPDGADTGLWEQSRETMDDLWRRSRDKADSWWEGSRESAGELWERSRATADDAWNGTRRYLEPQPEDHFGEVWDGVLPTLEETLALQERQAELPESSWFGEDQASNQESIDKLLDQAVAVLSTSGVEHYRDEIEALQQEIAKARKDIAEYRRQRVSAPQESLVKRTVSDYEDAIDAREEDIRRYQNELEEVKRRFGAELREMGLELDDEQVEFLLSTVVGDNLIDLGIVFDNVKAITAQLETLVEESGEDLQSARRYYGMYVILLKSLHQMHLQVEQAIAGKYIPQIDAIEQRAAELSEQTRELLQQAPEKRDLLAGNLEASTVTISTSRGVR